MTTAQAHPTPRALRRAATKRLVLILGAVATSVALAACSSPVGSTQHSARAAGASPAAATTSDGCPQGLIQDTETAHGPSQQSSIEALDAALAVQLPSAPVCALTVDGDTADSTAYYVYWPKQGDAFATSVGDAFLKAGFRPASGGGAFQSGSADARVETFPAHDQNWSGFFGGAELVLLAGQFDGAPGMTASPVTGSGSAPLTWESSCMLTLAEVNAATRSSGLQFGGPAAADDDSTACEYAQTGVDLPLDIEVDFRPYSESGSYGWATSGTPSWTAPSASEGAANACAAATTSARATGAKAICTKAGDASIVISGTGSAALVFRPGDYFTVVQLFNGDHIPSLTDALLQMSKTLAGRAPGQS